jgi:hypothetical protein
MEDYNRLASRAHRAVSCFPMPASPRKVLYIRDVPADLSKKLKGAAAWQGTSLQEYVVEVLRAHIADLERAGRLPKSK